MNSEGAQPGIFTHIILRALTLTGQEGAGRPMSNHSLLYWQELEFSGTNSLMMKYPVCVTLHVSNIIFSWPIRHVSLTGDRAELYQAFAFWGGRHLLDPVRENPDSAADSNKSCLMVLEASIHQLGRSTVDIIFYIAFIKLFTLVAAASLAAKSQFIYEIASSGNAQILAAVLTLSGTTGLIRFICCLNQLVSPLWHLLSQETLIGRVLPG